MILNSEKDLKEYHGRLYADPQRQQNIEYWDFMRTEDDNMKALEIEIKEYYKTSIMTAFDLATWHDTNKVIQHVMNECAVLAKGKVLDFGGGIGTNCINISQYATVAWKKPEIHYYDICRFCIDFAKWRFKKYNVSVKILDELETNYDTICMIDVIGHIVDKKKCLEDMINRLNVGGQLLLTNDAVESEAHPMHIAFDFDFDEFMEQQNMRLRGRQHLEVWLKQ